jgi:hypothetical protein
VVNPMVYPALRNEAERGGVSRTIQARKTEHLQRIGTVWRSLSDPVGMSGFAQSFVRDEEAAGSNPASPTTPSDKWIVLAG